MTGVETWGRLARFGLEDSFDGLKKTAAIFVLFMLNAQDRFLFTLDYGQSKGAIDGGEVWRVFTAMFLHANETHILFNMWALYLFGPSLERRFGSLSFASLYLAAGLGGGALYHVVGRTALAGSNPAVRPVDGGPLATGRR